MWFAGKDMKKRLLSGMSGETKALCLMMHRSYQAGGPIAASRMHAGKGFFHKKKSGENSLESSLTFY